jgi:hypothetical protein
MARQRRRNLRSVDVYPLDDAPRTQEFAAGCRTMAELYSLTLARAKEPIKATVSWARIFLDRRVQPGAPSLIPDEPPDGYGFSDGMRCAPAILEVEASLRPLRYLKWLHERMLELARARQWDETVLHQAFQDCVDAELTLVLTSKPRSSPDRRHRATITLRMDAEGTGSIMLTIADRVGAERGRTTISNVCSVDDFRRVANHLRWENSVEVTSGYVHPIVGIPGLHRLTARVGEVFDAGSAPDPDSVRGATAHPGDTGVDRDMLYRNS